MSQRKRKANESIQNDITNPPKKHKSNNQNLDNVDEQEQKEQNNINDVFIMVGQTIYVIGIQ